ncbi:unnamed protein product (macronuclear) [Paramecium tetraurelia]|uniref:Uncharacterized protein n=1 Tax=Paramecium tetraurelia TaxID=5888 RepID=A0EDL1_PARTE|nr:uncharacterized protein GSPATT00025721001 [Paramecium tetraurelia]CAK93378.1 unnamed protein product [Paramecium tetraurelia]|eukprot:XP_001460775.1 hypothetical protein (macronuclear) [Paramecium tetraurelia strain d4-2]
MKQKKASDWDWNKKGTLIYGTIEFKPQPLVLGFDMDETLIKTKSGKKFAKDANDWQWWNPKVIPTIQDYFKQGYSIVIFTNQNGIEKGHTKESDIKTKIESLQKELKIPLAAFIASSDDNYRKPRVDMWKDFQELTGTKADMAKSIYCGDAAGRVKGKTKDFTDTDLKFALNLGLIFRTPEQLFLKDDLNEDYSKQLGFNPKSIPKEGFLFKESKVNKFTKPDKPEMIIMIGAPGSGKSTFVHNHLNDYTRVNRDSLKTKEKCLKVAEQAIKEKKYLVIDNTNPTPDDRAAFIKLAQDNKYPVRGFFLEVSKDLCLHNDTQRDTNNFREHFSKKVGKMPINMIFSKVTPPTKDEGFSEVLTINFIAGPFKNKDDEDAFYSFVHGKN